MFEEEKLIDISRIDLDDQKYRISIDNTIDSLLESISTTGLITSCILRKVKNQFVVVSGFRRILSMKHLKCKVIPARVIVEDTREKTDLFCAKISIIENAFHRELNLIEQAKGVALLKLYLSFAQIEKASSIIFNTNLNRKIIKQLFEISGMDKSVHNLVLKKRLSMNNVIKISSFDSETFNAFILIGPE